VIKLTSYSEAETKKIGRRIGALLKSGDVVALVGELGAGKTTFVKGLVKGLGVPLKEKDVTSPTFTLVHEYEGREKVFHMDWYRLGSLRRSDQALCEECFDSDAVTVVEWADRDESILPKHCLRVELKHKDVHTRRIEISSNENSRLRHLR